MATLERWIIDACHLRSRSSVPLMRPERQSQVVLLVRHTAASVPLWTVSAHASGRPLLPPLQCPLALKCLKGPQRAVQLAAIVIVWMSYIGPHRT